MSLRSGKWAALFSWPEVMPVWRWARSSALSEQLSAMYLLVMFWWLALLRSLRYRYDCRRLLLKFLVIAEQDRVAFSRLVRGRRFANEEHLLGNWPLPCNCVLQGLF